MSTVCKSISSHSIQVGGGIKVRPRPDELAYPLRRDEFDALLEGEPLKEEKRWHDIALASSIASLVGLLGALDLTHWSEVWVGRQWGHLLVLAVLGAGSIGWLTVFGVQRNRIRHSRDLSAFTRVAAGIKAFFEENSTTEG
jgi:hypothetical protein